MSIVVTGSVAFDYIMSFPGFFKDHILPEKIDILSVSFLVDSLKRQRGGCATNIAYNLALLGERPTIMATVGQDFAEYRTWLESRGVDTSGILVIEDDFTASFFVSTDQRGSQIASFYTGAMSKAGQLTFRSAGHQQAQLAIVSPNDPAAMTAYCRECADGMGPVGVGDHLAKVAAGRPAINVGLFIGHGSVRSAVMGQVNREATPDELEKMRELVRTGMREGAFGLSTGLFYVPGNYAPLDEVIELARVAGQFGGIHQSHMRDEASHVLDSVRDTIAIGERGGLPTQVSHHKIIGKLNWGMSADTLRLIDEARARGVDATIDQYPYTASSSPIQGGLVPQWAQAGGREAMLEGLRDEATRGKVLAAVASSIETDRGGGDPGNVVLAACAWDPTLAGKSLAQVLRDRGQPVTIPGAAALVLEIVEKGGCSAVYHAISEDDVVRIMKHPATMIASDAVPGIPTFGRNVPHPRAYGTFARVLGLYVREKQVLTLEEAVRKMSAFPAQRMGLGDRGLLRPGMKADVAVFNPATITDMATFDKPHQYAVGVAAVLVNGQVTLADGTMTGVRAGRPLGRIARSKRRGGGGGEEPVLAGNHPRHT